MKLTRIKPHFWSQLLIGMIAIFALPTVQHPSHLVENQTENYQNTRAIQQQTCATNCQVQQIIQPLQTCAILPCRQILSKIEPHFFTQFVSARPPIRAGPFA